ncbi:hypothetical protein D3C72_301030 [compost metagenome]
MNNSIEYFLMALIFTLFSGLGNAESYTSEDMIAQRPLPETAESCQEYLKITHRQLKEEYERVSQCRSTTPPNISTGAECGFISHKVVQNIMAWPHCENAQRMCSLKIAFDDALKCVHDANMRKSKKDRDLRDSLNKIKEADDKISEAISVIRDPVSYVENKIFRHLEVDVQAKLRATFLNENGKITPLGVKETDELYAWGFDKTTQNKNLISNNSLISAIQKSSFTNIGKFHQQMLGEMQTINASIARFENEYDSQFKQQPAMKSMPKKSLPPSSGVDCTILSDGKRSSELSIDNPDKFNELITLCGG